MRVNMSETKNRPTWDQYFIEIASVVSKRSSCDRANVGAVIVKDKRILETGYNGAPWSEPTCIDDGHLMVEGHCVRTIHAEINALLQATQDGR